MLNERLGRGQKQNDERAIEMGRGGGLVDPSDAEVTGRGGEPMTRQDSKNAERSVVEGSGSHVGGNAERRVDAATGLLDLEAVELTTSGGVTDSPSRRVPTAPAGAERSSGLSRLATGWGRRARSCRR